MKYMLSESKNLGSFREQCILNDIQDLLEKTKYFKRYNL